MTDYTDIVQSMVNASAGKLELVMLDDAYCLRATQCRAHTLSAGSRHEGQKDACRRIVRRLFKKCRGKYGITFRSQLAKYGIPNANSIEELSIKLALLGGVERT